MLNELNRIVNQTLRERINKSIIRKLINDKVIFGLGAPTKIRKILKFTDELTEELYKPVTRNFQRRRVNVNGIVEMWAAYLIYMQAFSKDDNGIKNLLTVIDIFSKFVWIVPLKWKTGMEVANAFSMILKERRPTKMWVDKGREFYNKDFQKVFELYCTDTEEKSCVIERFNRTSKLIDKMFKYFFANNTTKFVDVLDLLVDQSNNAIHSSTKMTSKKASRKENGNKVWRHLYPQLGDKTMTPTFSIVIVLE